MLRKTSFVMLLNLLLFTSIGYAKAIMQNDPCGAIEGQWHGTWYDQGDILTRDCKWQTSVNVSRYQDTVRLDVSLFRGNHRSCKDSNLALSGTCKNARLSVSGNGQNFTGSIFGTNISLSSYRVEATLNK